MKLSYTTGLYRPRRLQDVVEALRVSKTSADEGGNVGRPTCRPSFTPQEILLVLISVRM